MMSKRWHVFFSGRVQGVGFRFTCLQSSRNQSVTGWVKNLPDGRVEMVVEATAATFESYINEIRSSTHGSVQDMDVTDSAATGEFSSMTIKR